VAIPRDLLMIVLAVRLIPTFGARGLAAAYAVSWTLAFCVTAVLVFQIGVAPAGPRQVLAEAEP
jgi:K+ transporter